MKTSTHFRVRVTKTIEEFSCSVVSRNLCMGLRFLSGRPGQAVHGPGAEFLRNPPENVREPGSEFLIKGVNADYMGSLPNGYYALTKELRPRPL